MRPNQILKVPHFNFPENIFTFYLSHPFASREYIRNWEQKFEENHPNIALMNPFYDVEGEGREDVKARDEGRSYSKDKGYNWRLVRRDLIAIDFSRGILGIVDDNNGRSIGTHMEWVYARGASANPKLCICTVPELFEHPWIQTHFHEVYHSFEDFEGDVEARVAHVKKKWGF